VLCCFVAAQIFSTDQQLAFELQGSSFKLVVGTLQVTAPPLTCAANNLAAAVAVPIEQQWSVAV
jgi:hypothetical protein